MNCIENDLVFAIYRAVGLGWSYSMVKPTLYYSHIVVILKQIFKEHQLITGIVAVPFIPCDIKDPKQLNEFHSNMHNIVHVGRSIIFISIYFFSEIFVTYIIWGTTQEE